MKTLNLDNGADRLLLLLLCTDVLLVILDILHRFTQLAVFDSPYFALNVDRSISEIFLYVQYYSITVLFVLLAFQRKTVMMVVWSVVFAYLLLDDLMRLHEAGGELLSTQFDLSILAYGPLGVRAPGEAIYYALVGGLIVALVVGAYRLGNSEFRSVSRRIAVYLTIFAVFAVGGDVIHHAVSEPLLSSIFDIIEELGEIVAINLIVWHIFALTGWPEATG